MLHSCITGKQLFASPAALRSPALPQRETTPVPWRPHPQRNHWHNKPRVRYIDAALAAFENTVKSWRSTVGKVQCGILLILITRNSSNLHSNFANCISYHQINSSRKSSKPVTRSKTAFNGWPHGGLQARRPSVSATVAQPTCDAEHCLHAGGTYLTIHRCG